MVCFVVRPVVYANWLGNVLEFVLTAVVEADVDLRLRVLEGGRTQDDATG